MASHGKFNVSLLLVLILLLALSGPISAGAAKPAPVTVRLTSITIDPEDASGATTNAPGAWSTNLADPLCQAGVWSHGDFLNGTLPGIGLGEISIPLKQGMNTFKLVGLGVFPYQRLLRRGAVLRWPADPAAGRSLQRQRRPVGASWCSPRAPRSWAVRTAGSSSTWRRAAQSTPRPTAPGSRCSRFTSTPSTAPRIGSLATRSERMASRIWWPR